MTEEKEATHTKETKIFAPRRGGRGEKLFASSLALQQRVTASTEAVWQGNGEMNFGRRVIPLPIIPLP